MEGLDDLDDLDDLEGLDDLEDMDDLDAQRENGLCPATGGEVLSFTDHLIIQDNAKIYQAVAIGALLALKIWRE